MTRISIDLVARGTDTGGRYALLDVHAPAGTSPPPSMHAELDATVYVLQGSLELRCGDQRRTLHDGEHAQLPRSSPCRLEALTDVHLICIGDPPGMETVAELAGAAEAIDADDRAALLAAAGIRLLPANWGLTD